MDLLILFLVSLVPVGWLSGGYTIFGYDSGFRLNGIDHLFMLLHNWNPTVNYGIDWSINRAFLVLQLPEALLSSMTGSLAIAQMIVFTGWFFVIGLSMYVFLRNLFPESKFRFFRIFSSIFYMYNFFILNGWLNAERAKFSLYAALPVALLLMFRQAFKNARPIYSAIAFGLLYAIFNGGGSPPLFGGTLVTIILAGIIFSIGVWRQKGISVFFRLLGAYLLFGLSFFVFNAYWLLPLVGLVKESYTSAVAAQGGIGGLIEWEKVFSRNASYLNLFRLQGFADWYGNSFHPHSAAYLTNPILIFVSFMPAIVIFSGLIRFGIREVKRSFLLLFLSGLLCIGVVITAGSHPPVGNIYLLLMRYLPGFAVFRSSFFKFAPSVWFAVIVLSGYYLTLFINTYLKNKFTKTILWVVCILGIFVYHYPFFSLRSFEINRLFSTRVNIPPYVYEMKQEIEQKTKVNDRILILPDLDPGYITLPMDAYTWSFFSADILPRVLTNRSFLAGDANDDALTKLIYRSFYTGDSARFRFLASLAGVTHILWRGDVELSPSTKSNRPLVDDEKVLTSMQGIASIAKTGPWQLYQIDGVVRPMISIATDPVYSTGRTSGDVLFAGETATVRAEPGSNQNSPQIAGAECIMCDPDEFKKFEAGVYLPPPDSRAKSLLKQIIQLIKPSPMHTQSDEEMIDEKLSNAISVLSSAVLFNDSKQSESFSDLLSTIGELYNGLPERNKIIYSNRLYAYMLAMERLVKGYAAENSITSAILPFKEKLTGGIFISDDSSFRYIVTVGQEGYYRILGSDLINNISVDDILIVSPLVKLNKGFHTIELSRNGRTIAPFVFLVTDNSANGKVEQIVSKRISSTTYEGNISIPAAESEVLVFNQRFDPRWQFSLLSPDGKRQIADRHYEVNGYANGWILDTGTAGHFEITYTTEVYSAGGWIISISGFVIAIIFLIDYAVKYNSRLNG